MPIYEYRCTACGHELEAIQKMSDEPLTVCPVCGEATLQKLISAAGFRLKGGGWYETDFKSSKRRNVVESDAGAKPGAGSGDKAKSKAEPKRDPQKKTSTPTGSD